LENALQASAKPLGLLRLEIAESTGGVDPGSPQHLVRQHIAQTGNNLLIHEH
jgi:hypothetical protein